jgi:hypothetical protein
VISVQNGVFHVVGGGVNENVVKVPDGRGDVELLLDGAEEDERLVEDEDRLFAGEGDVVEVVAPGDSLQSGDFSHVDLVDDLPGGDVVEHGDGLRSDDDLSERPGVDHVDGREVGDVLDATSGFQKAELLGGGEDGDLVLSDEDCGDAVSVGAVGVVLGS